MVAIARRTAVLVAVVLVAACGIDDGRVTRNVVAGPSTTAQTATSGSTEPADSRLLDARDLGPDWTEKKTEDPGTGDCSGKTADDPPGIVDIERTEFARGEQDTESVGQVIVTFDSEAAAVSAMDQLAASSKACDGVRQTQDGVTYTYRVEEIPFATYGDDTFALRTTLENPIFSFTADLVVVRVDGSMTVLAYIRAARPSGSLAFPAIVAKAADKL